jgi:diguanylate cyclase (GGDEF)-like protein
MNRKNSSAQADRIPILIVDDEKIILQSLEQLLTLQNYDVISAASGEEGLELFRKYRPPVVIADQIMSGMNGTDLFIQINRLNSHTFKILLTGYSDISNVIRAINEGSINRYISKPFDTTELLQIVGDGKKHYLSEQELHRLHEETESQRQALDNANQELNIVNQKLKNVNLLLEKKIRLKTYDLRKKNNKLLGLNKRLNHLFSISTKLTASFHEETILRYFCDSLFRCYQFQKIVCYLVTKADETRPAKIYYGPLLSKEMDQGNFVAPIPPEVIQVLKQQKMPLLDTSHILLPLFLNNELHGILSAMIAPTTPILDDLELRVLSSVMMHMNTLIENSQLFQNIMWLSMHDGLTSLLNHRTFYESLVKEVRRAGRYSTDLALIMADIDHFKKINDEYGHQAGDKVLAEIGALLKNSARKCDVVARYGGEEFALLMPQTPLDGAAVIAERIRTKVAETEFEIEGKKFRVTISMGIASLVREMYLNHEKLLERADTCLYEAKHKGRNQVVTDHLIEHG